jgi:hypothetical protein
MRAFLMVVTNILPEQTFQMAFIHRNDLIQQISSAASHPPPEQLCPSLGTGYLMSSARTGDLFNAIFEACTVGEGQLLASAANPRRGSTSANRIEEWRT